MIVRVDRVDLVDTFVTFFALLGPDTCEAIRGHTRSNESEIFLPRPIDRRRSSSS
jgi:hypothetical protein